MFFCFFFALQAAEKSTLKAKLGLLGTKTVRGTVESFILLLHRCVVINLTLKKNKKTVPSHKIKNCFNKIKAYPYKIKRFPNKVYCFTCEIKRYPNKSKVCSYKINDCLQDVKHFCHKIKHFFKKMKYYHIKINRCQH